MDLVQPVRLAQLLDRGQRGQRRVRAKLPGKLWGGLRKPPRVILQRFAGEFRAAADRVLSPWYAQRLTPTNLLRALEAESVDQLWVRLASRPYVCPTEAVAAADLEQLCLGAVRGIEENARRALAHQVNLLGSGLIELGTPIDWHRDFKSGHRWPPAYFRSIEYNNLHLPSDVKVPWEISRLQWLIPVGQAYALSGDEKYAEAVRDILRDWIEMN